jgi:hypothetical protein
MLSLVVSCYGNKNNVYSKKIGVVKESNMYDIDRIENGIVVLISKDLKKVKKIKESYFKKEIKEGYQVTYIDGEVYVNKNDKLRDKITKLQFELNPENKKLSLNL